MSRALLLFLLMGEMTGCHWLLPLGASDRRVSYDQRLELAVRELSTRDVAADRAVVDAPRPHDAAAGEPSLKPDGVKPKLDHAILDQPPSTTDAPPPTKDSAVLPAEGTCAGGSGVGPWYCTCNRGSTMVTVNCSFGANDLYCAIASPACTSVQYANYPLSAPPPDPCQFGFDTDCRTIKGSGCCGP